MTTTNDKTTKVIGLWLDTTSDAPGDGGTWIVSRDEMYDNGEAATTRTVKMFPTDEYDAARAYAVELADKEGRCVIETEMDNTQACIYQPSGAVNPLA
jgi:hypothetical protein